MYEIPSVTVHQLAPWLFHKEQVAVLDIRSFREYHTSHICSALNLGGNRAFKRRLLAHRNALAPFIALLVGVSVENLRKFIKIVLYDQNSADQSSLSSDSFTQFVISGTAKLFPNAVLLQGGFVGFCAAYPELCWQHPDKLPDEEFVGVKADSGLENLLQECLYKLYHEIPPSNSLSPGERSITSTRQPSSCSSCESSSSRQSCDSGVVLSASSAVMLNRKTISRVTSAPVKRPTTVVASFSVDDVIMTGSSSRRPPRLRPNTLSLCSPSFSTSTASTTAVNSLTNNILDRPSRCTFASSFRFLSTPPPSTSSLQSSRPSPTVSAALSAEAFESPLPTAVLPHLLIGCQADAMSAEICADFRVTHVINVSADGEMSPHVASCRFLRIPIHDNGKADIVQYFDKAFAFLAVLDIRSFREYHTSHICSALNLGGNRAFKRRLLAHRNALAPFIALLVGVSVENLRKFIKIVLYDQNSADQSSLSSDSFTQFVISGTAKLFPNAVLLQGGFVGFCAAYPELCWQHPDKLPDEEFVGVKADSGLENLLQECLYKLYHEIPPSNSLSPGERSITSTRQPSSCSSCESSSSRQSCDSGVVLSASSAVMLNRKTISRVTSAPVKRPTTVVASFSVDDVIMTGSSSRRPPRLRPNTLSLCSPSFSTSTASTTAVNSLTNNILDRPSRCTFASSFRFLSTPPPSTSSLQSSRPSPTVSAALSAEAFESPLPTAVLPHLLIGCQADAMSAEICADFRVTHVINVSADGEMSPHVASCRFLRIPIHDNGKADIVQYFDKAFAFLVSIQVKSKNRHSSIRLRYTCDSSGFKPNFRLNTVFNIFLGDSAKRSGGRVLIHCFAGISRSPTLAIAYLMHNQRITFDEAYNRVKLLRPKISPNFNFIGQLTDFEHRLNLSLPSSTSAEEVNRVLPVIIVPTVTPTQAAIPENNVSENTQRIMHQTSTCASAVTVSTMTIPTPSTISGPVRPVSLSLRRPSLKPMAAVTSKKRDRTQYLSPNSVFFSSSDNSSPGDDEPPFTYQVSNTTSSLLDASTSTSQSTFVARRKRSRFGPLLPSPSTAIASLDLSSPTDDQNPQNLNPFPSTPPPPPSPRPRRLRRSSPLRVDETRRFSLSTFSDLSRAALAACAAAVTSSADAPSSDIDSEIDMASSNPTIISSGLHSPSAAHLWLLGESCRHQQATAESSCHSSLSSSSNSQHTSSFPIS
nr:hypothetical transcript [Hymenolepis microstoma]